MDLSLCGETWDDVDPGIRESHFTKHQTYPTELIGNNGEPIGQGKFIYRVNGEYYKEAEAWKIILGISMCSTEIDAKTEKVVHGPMSPMSTQEKKCVSPKSEKLVSSLRPSVTSLNSFNLKEGENDLVYEYHVTESVVDKVEVKIYLYKSTDRLVISDIDGTITK